MTCLRCPLSQWGAQLPQTGRRASQPASRHYSCPLTAPSPHTGSHFLTTPYTFLFPPNTDPPPPHNTQPYQEQPPTEHLTERTPQSRPSAAINGFSYVPTPTAHALWFDRRHSQLSNHASVRHLATRAGAQPRTAVGFRSCHAASPRDARDAAAN